MEVKDWFLAMLQIDVGTLSALSLLCACVGSHRNRRWGLVEFS